MFLRARPGWDTSDLEPAPTATLAWVCQCGTEVEVPDGCTLDQVQHLHDSHAVHDVQSHTVLPQGARLVAEHHQAGVAVWAYEGRAWIRCANGDLCSLIVAPDSWIFDPAAALGALDEPT